ncbi:glycoside hydrolase family 128 protein [Pyrenophora tritici-repentis]|uniref:Glycoside hydrolase family 128 protein n=1 Tax=Pyrenophora tritici-repentis TaxID=45151 RepID=A0A2W1FFT4_9PLEO|nr:hypothetical protein PtrV1_11433 [Pyrenophora tritici-repentis]KAF7444236.1 Glycoside hydrolase family 128 protein [Pyrenophora tritici-repentis]KAF7565116.1 glycoside hydrolase family 128 protein [Pyrenophora tritici-repentis]KAI0570734.1 Glycoside hydrolase family 128 protein [Pyrenophora tritici-repentis]KAI0576138.1 Glycoside hydrolase family 128 protein [Pyrenophora tritici-repentis]
MNFLVLILTTLSLLPLTLSSPLSHNHKHATTHDHVHTANLTVRAAPPLAPSHQRRGIAYNDPSIPALFDKRGSLATWCYNWESSTASSTAWFRFVPMLHTLLPEHTAVWKANAEEKVRSNYQDHGETPTWFLGFNEPDNCVPYAGGSCIDVGTAVSAWKKYMDPLADLNPKVYLGSPAVTNATPTDTTGLGWLAKFLKACSGCQIDHVNIHWYDAANNAAYFKQHIEDTRKIAGGRPIWVTEFHASGSDDEVKAFLDDVMPWMDNSNDIHRYAYFMAQPGDGLLVSPDGKGLSAIGQEYNFHDG